MRPLRASLAWNLLVTLAASQLVDDAAPQLPGLAARSCVWSAAAARTSSRICSRATSSRVADAGKGRCGRLRGGGKVQEEWWMREWESEPDLDIYGDGDHEDEKESSDTDTEADDYRDYGPVVEVGLRPRYTHWSTMAFWEVWPGDGEKPREGQLVRLRWNVAKHPAALRDNLFEEGARPWKGDFHLKDGSALWPEDEAFEFIFGCDPHIMPGFEEMVGEMRAGGRVHCVIPPDLGFRIEEEEAYDSPFPSDAEERQRLMRWLGEDSMARAEWRQKVSLAWEIDIESVCDLDPSWKPRPRLPLPTAVPNPEAWRTEASGAVQETGRASGLDPFSSSTDYSTSCPESSS